MYNPLYEGDILRKVDLKSAELLLSFIGLLGFIFGSFSSDGLIMDKGFEWFPVVVFFISFMVNLYDTIKHWAHKRILGIIKIVAFIPIGILAFIFYPSMNDVNALLTLSFAFFILIIILELILMSGKNENVAKYKSFIYRPSDMLMVIIPLVLFIVITMTMVGLMAFGVKWYVTIIVVVLCIVGLVVFFKAVPNTSKRLMRLYDLCDIDGYKELMDKIDESRLADNSMSVMYLMYASMLAFHDVELAEYYMCRVNYQSIMKWYPVYATTGVDIFLGLKKYEDALEFSKDDENLHGFTKMWIGILKNEYDGEAPEVFDGYKQIHLTSLYYLLRYYVNKNDKENMVKTANRIKELGCNLNVINSLADSVLKA